MDLSFKILMSPGEHDGAILDFFKANDNDFYPPIAARKELTLFVQSVYKESGQYLLCYDNDRIVGLTTILANHPNFLYYYQYIAVDKDYRHKGIGNKLYDMVTKICYDQGALRAIVKTWSLNKTSQAMFRKHGFFHAETTEDDRSKGVHSYFYFKSFANYWFKQPLKCLCVIGSGMAMVNFTRMLSAITKDTPGGSGQLSVVTISDPGIAHENNAEKIRAFIAGQVPAMVSHVMFTDLSAYMNIEESFVGNVEVPGMQTVTRHIFNAGNKKWFLAGKDMEKLKTIYNVQGLVVPTEQQQARMADVVAEIASGFITPAYHKKEFADMALESGCNGILLGSMELHSMFGFDRQYNEVEIFDPLLELAFIIQNNRIGKRDYRESNN